MRAYCALTRGINIYQTCRDNFDMARLNHLLLQICAVLIEELFEIDTFKLQMQIEFSFSFIEIIISSAQQKEEVENIDLVIIFCNDRD